MITGSTVPSLLNKVCNSIYVRKKEQNAIRIGWVHGRGTALVGREQYAFQIRRVNGRDTALLGREQYALKKKIRRVNARYRTVLREELANSIFTQLVVLLLGR